MTYLEFSRMMPEEQLLYNHRIANNGIVLPDKLIREWAEQTKYMLMRQIRRRNIGNTGALEKSLESIVNGSVNVQKIKFEFLKYGTFVDMGVGRGRSLEDIREGRFNIGIDRLLGYKVTQQRNRKFRKKSDWQWYSKALYGAISKGLTKFIAEAYGQEALKMFQIPQVYELYK